MGVKLWINRNKIYLSIYQNKKLWRESTGLSVSTDSKQQKEIMKMAEVLRAKREMQFVAQINGLIDSNRGLMLLSEYMTDIAELKKGESEKIFKRVIPYVIKYGDIKVSAITYHWYEGFKAYLLKHEKLQSSYTQAKYLSLIKQSVKKALREKLIANDPTEGVSGITIHESNRQFLTSEEIRRLVNCEYKSGMYYIEIRPAFFFSLLTGLRISDVRMLRWGHIDGNRIVKRQRKTSDYVYIPIQPIALEVIGYSDELPKDSLIFPMLASVDDMSYTNRYLKKWAEKAGVKKNVTWHVARHTYATQLIKSGADIYTVSKLLGHAKVETTQKYAKVTDQKKAEAVQALPDWGMR